MLDLLWPQNCLTQRQLYPTEFRLFPTQLHLQRSWTMGILRVSLERRTEISTRSQLTAKVINTTERSVHHVQMQ